MYNRIHMLQDIYIQTCYTNKNYVTVIAIKATISMLTEAKPENNKAKQKESKL